MNTMYSSLRDLLNYFHCWANCRSMTMHRQHLSPSSSSWNHLWTWIDWSHIVSILSNRSCISESSSSVVLSSFWRVRAQSRTTLLYREKCRFLFSLVSSKRVILHSGEIGQTTRAKDACQICSAVGCCRLKDNERMTFHWFSDRSDTTFDCVVATNLSRSDIPVFRRDSQDPLVFEIVAELEQKWIRRWYVLCQ